mmetsp:Transcript_15702/g.41614  ORF Transcript_15702/g.41614 Transcript_15702/m.41614 type:complete len:213 (+) Transcript_15702:131-769(+)
MRAAQTGLPCGSHVWAAIPVRRARSGLLGEHDLKFLKADGARFVGVHLLHDLQGDRQVLVFKDQGELFLGDLSVAILVEHPEGTPSRLVLEVLCACECRCQELRVVDRPRAIRVKAIQDVNEVIRHRDLGLLQAVHELGFAEGSILVLVQCDEVPAELLEVAVLQVLCDHGQNHLLQLRSESELLHVGCDVRVELHVHQLAQLGLHHPGVLE